MGDNTLKDYIRIIKVCSILSAICALLSVLLVNGAGDGYANIVQNYSIGLACSLLVAIITTHVQYQSLLAAKYADYICAIENLILELYNNTEFANLADYQYDEAYSRIDKCFKEVRRGSEGIYFFVSSRNRQKQNCDEVFKNMYLDLLHYVGRSKRDAVEFVTSKEYIISAINNFVAFLPDTSAKDSIIRIKSALSNEVTPCPTSPT